MVQRIGAGHYSDGMARVCAGQEYGYVNNLLQMEIPPQYYNAQPFHQGYACVRNNNKTYFLDKTGKVVLQVPFESVETDYSDGLIGVAR